MPLLALTGLGYSVKNEYKGNLKHNRNVRDNKGYMRGPHLKGSDPPTFQITLMGSVRLFLTGALFYYCCLSQPQAIHPWFLFEYVFYFIYKPSVYKNIAAWIS